MSPHIVVALSGHGFGHLAQTVAVFEALQRCRPELRVTLLSSLPEGLLRQRFPEPFAYQSVELDLGMKMHNALEVAAQDSWRWYSKFHANYRQRVRLEAERLAALQADLLYADIPYLGIAAAHQASVPAVALCSINWADIFRIYCGQLPGAERIYSEILESYRQAEIFLLPEPSAPMPNLENSRKIAPVAQRGRNRRQTLRQKLGIDPETQLALFGLGGISTDLGGGWWNEGDRLHWLVPDNMPTAPPNATRASALGMRFVDLIASSDLVITKTGYGTIVEAALASVPVLCAERGDGWPEEPGLFEWMGKHGRIRVIDWARMQRGVFSDEIDALLAQPATPRPSFADGAQEAAQILADRLG